VSPLIPALPGLRGHGSTYDDLVLAIASKRNLAYDDVLADSDQIVDHLFMVSQNQAGSTAVSAAISPTFNLIRLGIWHLAASPDVPAKLEPRTTAKPELLQADVVLFHERNGVVETQRSKRLIPQDTGTNRGADRLGIGR